MSDEVPPESSTPPVAEPPKFEGAEVPREPSGRVSRTADIDDDATVGTAEQITALTIRLAEIKSKGLGRKGSAERTLFMRLNMERTRLMRRRNRRTRDKIKLRLIKAQSAERIARRTVEEAAKAVDGTAQVLRSAITDFGKAAVEKLLPSLVEDLKSADDDDRREAQRMMRDITIAILDLHKAAQKKVNEAEKRGPVATQWPDEGAKT